MMELLTIFADTACLLVAAGAGAALHARRVNAREKKTPEPKLVCGCTHELAFHDPKTGECHKVVTDRRYQKLKNGVTTYEDTLAQCHCKVYTGELPPDWYARIIGGEAA